MKPILYNIPAFDSSTEQVFSFVWNGNQSFGNKLIICENNELIFRGFISSYELVFSDEDETCLEFYTHRGEKRNIAVFDSNGDYVNIDNEDDIESMYSGCYYAVPIPTAWSDANVQVDIQEEEFVFSFWENKIVYNPLRNRGDNLDDDNNDYYYYDDIDDTDYERETFYALGGDDYDE